MVACIRGGVGEVSLFVAMFVSVRDVFGNIQDGVIKTLK